MIDRFPSSRLKPAALLAGSLLVAGLLPLPARAAAAPSTCDTKAEADKAGHIFSEGIIAFELKQWLKAAIHFQRALDYRCEGQIGVVVPYGRWTYDYAPRTYLGLALHRMGCCLDKNGKRCSLLRSWKSGNWDDFAKLELAGDFGDSWQLAKFDPDSQRTCGVASGRLTPNGKPYPDAAACSVGSCLMVQGSNVVYCPVVDWWTKLVYKQVAIPDVLKAANQCERTATPIQWLRWRLTGSSDVAKESNASVCTALASALKTTDTSCRAY